MFSVSDESPVFLKNEVCLSTVCASFPHVEGTAKREKQREAEGSCKAVQVQFVWSLHAHALKSCGTLLMVWTVAFQAPLSMGFSRQEYWSEWVAISCSIVEPGPPAKLSPRLPAFFFIRTSQGIERTWLICCTRPGRFWVLNELTSLHSFCSFRNLSLCT